MILNLLLGLLPLGLLALTVYGFKSFILAILVFHLGVCLLLPLADLWRGRKKGGPSYGQYMGLVRFRQTAGQGLLWGGLFFILILIPGLLFWSRLGDPALISGLMRQMGYDPRWLGFYFVFMVIGNSLLEELYWRGYMWQRFLQSSSPAAAILWTALFYSSYHLLMTVPFLGWSTGLLLTGAVLAAGLFWGWLRRHSASLWPAIISHALADLAIFYILFFRIVPAAGA